MNSWKKIKLGDALYYVQPTQYIVTSAEYKESNEIPVLTPGKSFILGYTDEKHGVFTDVPTIIFDDFTTAFKYVDFPFKVKSSAMKMLLPSSEKYNIKFLYYLMLTLNFTADEHKRFWISQYSQQEIFIPPLEQQKKIAAILDAADAYRQKTKALIAKFDELSQSLFLDMFGDPVKNEKGWEKSSLQSVCVKITDGTHFSPEPQENGFPYVTAKHVKSHGLDFYSKPTFISQEAHNEIYKRCTPEYGDVLYIKDGATTGIACINTLKEPFSMLSSLALIKPNRRMLNSYYLCHWLNNPKIKSKLLTEFMSGAAIQRYTLTKINSFILSLPAITLQNQFAERVQAIETQKIQAQASLEKAEELFNSLLQKAFKGELV